MKPTTEQVMQWAREADNYAILQSDDTFDRKQIFEERFAALAYAAGAAAEREKCAGIDVKITVPHRDYSSMSPKEIYEEALMDATLSFRNAIRALGDEA